MKYALIGCGMISPNHIKAAFDSKMDIVALCDLNEDNLRKAYDSLPDELKEKTKCYTDHIKMLECEKPDLVALALGSGLKKKLSIDCMEHSANVIVEKPIALSLEDADSMIDTSKRCNVNLYVCHQLRYCPATLAIHSAIESGDFGKLLHANVRVMRNRNKAYFEQAPWRGTWKQDGGALMNQCIHYTDLLTWFMGEIDEVFAYTDNLSHPYTEAEDMGLALLKFKNGSYGVIEGTINSYPKNLYDAAEIFGEKGCVSVKGKFLDDVTRWEFESAPCDLKEAINHYDILDNGTGHLPFYINVKDNMEKGTPMVATAKDARDAIELILAIYESAAIGKPVKLPLKRGATIDYEGRFDK